MAHNYACGNTPFEFRVNYGFVLLRRRVFESSYLNNLSGFMTSRTCSDLVIRLQDDM